MLLKDLRQQAYNMGVLAASQNMPSLCYINKDFMDWLNRKTTGLRDLSDKKCAWRSRVYRSYLTGWTHQHLKGDV